MGTRKITREEAIKETAELFGLKDGVRNDKGSWFNAEKGTFFINKADVWRHEVIARLHDFYKNVYITDGQCRISPITLVWTTFTIEPVNDDEA